MSGEDGDGTPGSETPPNEETPDTHPEKFKPVRGTSGKEHKVSGKIFERINFKKIITRLIKTVNNKKIAIEDEVYGAMVAISLFKNEGSTMTVNDVVAKYDGRELLLHTRVLEDEEGYCPYLLIEGKKDSLRKLAEMILAVTEETGEEKFFISPDGSGSAHFAKNSTFGLYINCIE